MSLDIVPQLIVLPVELLALIVDHIKANIPVLRSCAMSCRTFRELCRPLIFAHVKLSTDHQYFSFRDLISTYPDITFLVTRLDIESPAPNWNVLRETYLPMVPFAFTEQPLCDVLARLDCLVSLRITSNNLPMHWSRLSQKIRKAISVVLTSGRLQSVSASRVVDNGCDFIRDLAGSLTLQDLCLKFNLDGSIFEDLAFLRRPVPASQRPPTLTSLSLHPKAMAPILLSFACASYIFTSNPFFDITHLRSLSLFVQSGEWNTLYKLLSLCRTSLEELSVSPSGSTKEVLPQAQKMPHLAFPRLKHLKVLSTAHSSYVPGLSLVEACPWLCLMLEHFEIPSGLDGTTIAFDKMNLSTRDWALRDFFSVRWAPLDHVLSKPDYAEVDLQLVFTDAKNVSFEKLEGSIGRVLPLVYQRGRLHVVHDDI